MNGLHAVVTGAANGVGRATARLLAQRGARVTGLDREAASADGTTIVAVDMADPASIDRVVADLAGVDLLANVAGVPQTRPALDVMRVNFLGLRHLSESLAPTMRAGGAIVHVASNAGNGWPLRTDIVNDLLDTPDFATGLAWCEANLEAQGDPYNFSKECVQVYTMRSSRPTQQRGVRTNSVCPAPIDTPLLKDFRETMTDKLIDWTVEQSNGRPVSPREVGLVLAFLGSDAASYVNGVNLLVDAGFTAAMTTGQVDFAAIS